MRVVLMTSWLAGLDRFPQLAELRLLITLGCVAYFGFVALFGQRAIFSHLGVCETASPLRRPAPACYEHRTAALTKSPSAMRRYNNPHLSGPAEQDEAAGAFSRRRTGG